MRFYLVGPYQWQEQLNGYAKQLEILGHQVTSSWLLCELPDDYPLEDVQKRAFASHDLIDIGNTETFIAFLSDDPAHGRGGRHVEYGYALGIAEFRRMQTVVIGETDNIFYLVEQVRRFADWESFIATVEDLTQPKLF